MAMLDSDASIFSDISFDLSATTQISAPLVTQPDISAISFQANPGSIATNRGPVVSNTPQATATNRGHVVSNTPQAVASASQADGISESTKSLAEWRRRMLLASGRDGARPLNADALTAAKFYVRLLSVILGLSKNCYNEFRINVS